MINPYECEQTTDLCPVAGVSVSPAAAALGFSFTPNTPYDCWVQQDIADLTPCDVMSNPDTPDWVKCMLVAAFTPRVL